MDLDARAYHAYKPRRWPPCWATRGRQAYGVVMVEGAGSPPKSTCATATSPTWVLPSVDCPVVLVADIDRGGVFAHLVGTLDCLSDSERARDRLHHQPLPRRHRAAAAGLDWLSARTGKPVFGVLPYLHGLHLDAEDAIVSARRAPRRRTGEACA
jgi:adenosylcobyric acid synthase